MIVVKAGGDLASRPEWRQIVAQEVVSIRARGPVVLVHGGGPQLDEALLLAGDEVERHAGRRVTSKSVLSRAIEIWRGTLSTQWVRAIHEAGGRAVGLSGVDGATLRAVRRGPVEVDGQVVDFGEVGDLCGVDTTALGALLDAALVPVLTPLAVTVKGSVLNINADTVAAHVAVALGASELVLLTRAPGILEDPDEPATVLSSATLEQLGQLEQCGAIHSGMRPKIAAIRFALEGGVRSATVRDGRVAGSTGTTVRAPAASPGAGTLRVPGWAPLFRCTDVCL